ncbi:MAG: SpoIID/LytB domain-containing protein [Actinomycetota bacterium]|nr:SpoIID/LytB domain-containing protein [Actinomycetota bacterium]
MAINRDADARDLRGGPRRFLSKVVAAALLGTVVATLPAIPARAATKVVITGGGWGHGLGLSQWGAYERAGNGWSADRILRHYYTDTTVKATNLPNQVRVGLLQGQSEIEFTSSALRADGGRLAFAVKGSEPFVSGGTNANWKVQPGPRGSIYLFKNGDVVRDSGDRTLGGNQPVVVEYEPYDTLVRVVDKDTSYKHGEMLLDSYGGSCLDGRCLRLVGAIPMEEYLLGIAEVSASWPKESLRVQAIIARTYASHKIKTTGQHRDTCDCAVYDSSYDQVYLGDDRRLAAGSYWGNWRRAVRSTEDHAVLYDGVPILALYMSSSGGHTEDNEDVWGGTPLPYLRGVNDRADSTSANINHEWRVEMSWSSFSSKLDAYFGTGPVQRFTLERPFGVSGRVTVVKADGSGGVRIVGAERTVRASGYQVKSALGLKDTLFRVDFVD